MSTSSVSVYDLNIYEEVLDEETIYDCSSQRLEAVPDITNKMICVSNKSFINNSVNN